MDLYTIPVEDKFIIYRPLARLAFIGNGAMASLAERIAAGEDGQPVSPALEFLKEVGFMAPDLEPPAPPAGPFKPTHAALLLTNQCHLRCIYCYANGGVGPAQEVSFKVARAAIDYVCQNAQDLGQPQLELVFHGGGEPVHAWQVLRKATEYARHQPLPAHIAMTSSGVWSRHQLAWLLENLNGLTISIDGGPATQNRQRPFASGRGSFATVMRTLTALDAPKFPYGIRMTALSPWTEQLPADVRFLCEETNCQQIHVEPAFNPARGTHKWPTPTESEAFTAAFIEAYDIASAANRKLTYTGARPWLLSPTFCTAPYNALIVNPAGQLVTCYEVTTPGHPLIHLSVVGSITGQGVIVDETARRKLHQHFAERRAMCRDCFCYWHCAGDCYTRTFPVEAGQHTVLGQRCEMNRSITAQLLLRNIMNGNGVWQGNGTTQSAHMLIGERIPEG